MLLSIGYKKIFNFILYRMISITGENEYYTWQRLALVWAVRMDRVMILYNFVV